MSAHPVIVIAAGGTGGHMVPAEALSHELSRRGYAIELITDERGLAYADTFAATAKHTIRASSPGRGSAIGTVASVITGAFQALRILKAAKAVTVVGFGGYPALPTMLAARIGRCPYVLHEQNAVLGRSHRMVASGARSLALSFEGSSKIPNRVKGRSVVTGTPVRAGIAALADTPYPEPDDDAILRLLVLGGSQGARILSEIVPAALSLLPAALRQRLQISQQCREEDLAGVKNVYVASGIAAEVATFFPDVPERLRWTHLVISRAGASTVSELAVAGRPAILVPLAIATDDHQTANAEVLASTGGAWIMQEAEFTPAALAKLVQRLALKSGDLALAARNVASRGRPQATQLLADLVERAVLGEGGIWVGRSGQQESPGQETNTEHRETTVSAIAAVTSKRRVAA